MELIRRLSIAAALFALGAAFQINAHEDEREHLHCSDPGVNCTIQEDIVRGYRLVTPNSSPTTYTGGNYPENSSNTNPGESGYIDYEESYGSAYVDSICDPTASATATQWATCAVVGIAAGAIVAGASGALLASAGITAGAVAAGTITATKLGVAVGFKTMMSAISALSAGAACACIFDLLSGG